MNERAVNPKNEHIVDTQTRFFTALAQPEATIRMKNLFAKGLQQNGEAELNLGKHLSK